MKYAPMRNSIRALFVLLIANWYCSISRAEPGDEVPIMYPKRVQGFERELGKLSAVAVCKDDQRLLIAGDLGVAVVDRTDFRILHEIAIGGMTAIDIDQTETHAVLIEEQSNHQYLWNIPNQTIQVLPGKPDFGIVERLSSSAFLFPRFVQDEDSLAVPMSLRSGGEGLAMINTRKGRIIDFVAVHPGGDLRFAFSSDARWLISGDRMGQICLWDLKRPGDPIVLEKQISKSQVAKNSYKGSSPKSVVALHFLPNREHVIAVWYDLTAREKEFRKGMIISDWIRDPSGEWKLNNKRLIHEQGDPLYWFDSQFSPDGRYLAVNEQNHAFVRLFEVETLQPLARFSLVLDEDDGKFEGFFEKGSSEHPVKQHSPGSFRFSNDSRSFFITTHHDLNQEISKLLEFNLPHTSSE